MIDSRDLNELHPAVKRGAQELQRRMKEKGYNLAYSSTYRDFERQNALYAQGRSVSGKIVTNAKAGQSMHNYRLAFDIFKNVPGNEFSDDTFFKVAGQIWTDMGGEWGGSWKGFSDTPHFQFTNGLTLKQLQEGSQVAKDIKMKWELTDSHAVVKPEGTSATTKDTVESYKVVNVTSSLNIRSDSNTEASIVGSLHNGDVVQVSRIENGFARISNGWISTKYLEKV